MKVLILIFNIILIYSCIINGIEHPRYNEMPWYWINPTLEQHNTVDPTFHGKNTGFIPTLRTTNYVDNRRIKAYNGYRHNYDTHQYDREIKNNWDHDNVDNIHNTPTTLQYNRNIKQKWNHNNMHITPTTPRHYTVTVPVLFYYMIPDGFYKGGYNSFKQKYHQSKQTIKELDQHNENHSRENQFVKQTKEEGSYYKHQREYLQDYVNKEENERKHIGDSLNGQLSKYGLNKYKSDGGNVNDGDDNGGDNGGDNYGGGNDGGDDNGGGDYGDGNDGNDDDDSENGDNDYSRNNNGDHAYNYIYGHNHVEDDDDNGGDDGHDDDNVKYNDGDGFKSDTIDDYNENDDEDDEKDYEKLKLNTNFEYYKQIANNNSNATINNVNNNKINKNNNKNINIVNENYNSHNIHINKNDPKVKENDNNNVNNNNNNNNNNTNNENNNKNNNNNNNNNNTNNENNNNNNNNKDELSTNVLDYSTIIDMEDLFKKYKNKFKRHYNNTDDEETSKQNLFEKIEKLQRISESRKMRRTMYYRPSYSLTLNYLADMSEERFRKLLGYIRPTFLYERRYPVLRPYMYGYYWQRYKRSDKEQKKKITVFEKTPDLKITAQVDWRKSSCFSPVKKQGDCGSCWAFSATAVLECQYFLKVDNSTTCSLSQQDLIDCSQKNGMNGCKGGSMELAYLYVQSNLGLNKDEVYPYIASQNSHCLHEESHNALFSIEEWSMVQQNDEEALMQAVSVYGPVSAAIDASATEFQLYEKGVLCYVECSRDKVNHGIVVVGYDNINGTDVWIIRNSWGPDWGMEGYAYVCRGTNFCGISYSASFPILKKKS